MSLKLKCPFCGGNDIYIKSELEEETQDGFTDVVETFYRHCNNCHEEYVDSDLSDINCEQFAKFYKKVKQQYLEISFINMPSYTHSVENNLFVTALHNRTQTILSTMAAALSVTKLYVVDDHSEEIFFDTQKSESIPINIKNYIH